MNEWNNQWKTTIHQFEDPPQVYKMRKNYEFASKIKEWLSGQSFGQDIHNLFLKREKPNIKSFFVWMVLKQNNDQFPHILLESEWQDLS